MMPGPRTTALLSALFAALCVAVPLAWALLQADRDPRLSLRRAAETAMPDAEADTVLLLGLEQWPTRPQVVEDVTITSGATEIAFTGSAFAEEQFLVLYTEGLQPCSQQLAEVEIEDLLAVEQTVFLLPARYAQPAWPVLQFMDEVVQPLAEAGDPRLAQLRLGWVVMGYGRDDCLATDAALRELALRYGFQSGLRAAIDSSIGYQATYDFLLRCGKHLSSQQADTGLLWPEATP